MINTVWLLNIERELETDMHHLYALVRNFKNPPVLGETVLCYDEIGESTVCADVVIISDAGVVKLKVDHDSWLEIDD